MDNKPIFNKPAKNKQEAYEKVNEMSRNNDYITRNLLHYLYHPKKYDFNGIISSRQTNTSIPQQIKFTRPW